MTVGGVPDKKRVMFLYWGRRGAITRFAYEVQRNALLDSSIEPTLSVSRQNESFDMYAPFGASLFPVDTFQGGVGALAGLWRVRQLGRALQQRLLRDRTQAVIALMPHVWTPFVIPYVRKAGVRYATIVHDAVAHPGDRTALALRLLLMDADRADVVVTLSQAVNRQLSASGHAAGRPIRTLFHPDLSYDDSPHPARTLSGEPFRLLWFGRVMPYKGLGVFVEAMEMMQAQGTPIQIGVCGEGSLGDYEPRLRALGADIVNRWIGESEITDMLSRYDAVALSHIEASQSGVAAIAFGAGLPVIATPTGGLSEQVTDGLTGVVAATASPRDFATAVARLATDPHLYAQIRRNLAARSDHSMARFVKALVDAAT